MAEFRKAPDGQPTSNIFLQLHHSKADVADWESYERELLSKLENTYTALASRRHRKAELEWQLAQRLAEGLEEAK